MMYFLCASGGLIAGFILASLFAAGKIADIVSEAAGNRMALQRTVKANGVLRRELAELRAAHEAPRDHGYGASNG